MRAGDDDVDIRPGNAMPLGVMPVGTLIHNIELRPGQGGKLVRAAGASATLVKKGDDGYATVKLPSGEQRLIMSRCYATVGVLGNREHQNAVLGKAGAKRWMGVRQGLYLLFIPSPRSFFFFGPLLTSTLHPPLVHFLLLFGGGGKECVFSREVDK